MAAKMTLQLNGKKYLLVTLDFETYYDNEYTLSGNLSTSEYIRDARFQAHGVGIKIGAGKTVWHTGDKIKSALEAIDWTKCAMVGHNVAFDGFIASHVYGIKPALYIDTLSMARAAHGHHMRHNLDTVAKAHGLAGKTKVGALVNTKAKTELSKEELRNLGAYCIDDVNDTYAIFWKLVDYIPDNELELIDITIKMFCDPVLIVDIPRVQRELNAEVFEKMSAITACGASIEELMSNNKFAEKLREYGVEPPTKLSVTTGKEAFAFAKTDDGLQNLLSHKNPKVAALAIARLKVKSTIGETRAIRFLEAGRDGMALPVLLNYAGAHTHRWSGGNKINLQNLKRGGELRKSILAPAGYSVVVADSAQIEARVLAWLAGQEDLTDAFKNKRDIYSEFASELFGYKVNRKTSAIDEKGVKYHPHALEGFVGKVCVLGLGYGMGHAKLQATLASGAMGMRVELTEKQCLNAVGLYRNKNYHIRALWKKMDGIIESMLVGTPGTLGPLEYGKGYITLPNGMFLQYFGLHANVEVTRGGLTVNEASYLTRAGRSKIYGGLLSENVVQALARCIVATHMLQISRKYRVVTMTHDEIVAICPTENADTCLQDMLAIMSTPPEWALDLPLAAEGGHDVCYSK